MLLSDRRGVFRAGLHSLYLPIYDSLCASLPPEWQPYYGVRSMEEQDSLYAQGRTVPGSIVTWARAGDSPHNYGCASDWTYWAGNSPVWMDISDPRWHIYAKAVLSANGEWGGMFKRPDGPHNELKLSSWGHVGDIFRVSGLTAALSFIFSEVGHDESP